MWSSIRHGGPARQALSARAVERHPIRRTVTTKKNEGLRAVPWLVRPAERALLRTIRKSLLGPPGTDP